MSLQGVIWELQTSTLYELHNPQRRNIALSATEVGGTDVFPCLNSVIIFELDAFGKFDPVICETAVHIDNVMLEIGFLNKVERAILNGIRAVEKVIYEIHEIIK